MSLKTIETDCNSHCMIVQHGDVLTAAVTRREPSDKEVAAFMTSICSNIGGVVDDTGRLPLHMAASCGRRDLAQWLIRRFGAAVNAKDMESGYTALHRSLFYGQLHVAVSLIQLGASLTIPDYEALSPLDLSMKDRLPGFVYSINHLCEVYVWGSNSNYTLGTGNQQAKPQPEILECFRRKELSIREVCMDKFHSIMVTACGRVFSCGHGQGGRLGLGIEGTVLKPQEIALGRISVATSLNASTQSVGLPEVCIMAAVARDHTLLLMKSGAVLSCGMNTHHVLGHVPPPPQLVKPRPILAKYLLQVSGGIIGICAGRFHSVVWSQDTLLTFGLHGGQLGHDKMREKTVLLPKAVMPLHPKCTEISHVAASDGATVVVYKRRHIFVLHAYQKMRLAAKHSLTVLQIAVTGGHLDSCVDPSLLGDKGGTLKVAVLSCGGDVYLWQEKQLHLCRCILALNRSLGIRHLSICRSLILFITKDGEAFKGEVELRKKPDDGRLVQPQIKTSMFKNRTHRPPGFLDPSERETVRMERLPHIHRAVRITCDPKGRNFAVIQTHPSTNLNVVPSIPRSKLRRNFWTLLQGTTEDDALHDVVFKVGSRLFPAHQFIIASNSGILLDMLKSAREVHGGDDILSLDIDNIHPVIFEHLLAYMYSGKSSLTRPGPCKILITKCEKEIVSEDSVPSASEEIRKRKKIAKRRSRDGKEENASDDPETNPLVLAKEGAKRFGLTKLTSQLNAVRFENDVIVLSESGKKLVKGSDCISLNSGQIPEFHDVSIRTLDGKIYGAHKCVLAARCEYFHHMFAGGWIETHSTKELSLPLHSTVCDVLFDYIYNDETPSLDTMSCENLELAWKALICADQFLISPFKARCEAALASKLTLRNVATILEMAHCYNADQLVKCCYHYICLNLPAILEARSLEGLNPQILIGLRDYYHDVHPKLPSRVITPFSDAPPSDDIMELAKTQKIPWNPEEDMNLDAFDEQSDSLKSKQNTKKKARTRRSIDNVRARQRNESVSFTNSDDLDTSAECEPIDWNEIVEKKETDITLSFSQISIRQDNNVDPWVKVLSNSKIQKSVHARLNAAATAREEPITMTFTSLTALKQQHTVTSPSSTPASPAGGPLIYDKVFPELGIADGKVIRSSPISVTQKPITSEKRPLKLSQKQRKKIAAESGSSGSPPLSSGPKGWGLADEGYAVCSPPPRTSLADIMQEELLRAKRSNTSPSALINIKSEIVKTSLPESPRSHWGNFACPAGSPDAWTASPASPKSHVNFSDIVAEEFMERENWVKMRAKPLVLTQMEDKAIDDLIHFYNARDASEERLTVRRVINVHVAKPQWVTLRH